MTTARTLSVAFLAGAAVMIVELMGVRLLAPWFGQSQLVWTNVIGVVLAALALGQWLGGRASEGRGGPGPAALLAIGGAISLALPELVRWLSPLVLPADLPLLAAHPFVVFGSLLVALLGLGVPMAALGGVAPWLVHLSKEAQVAPGRVAGRILGAGTAGSLLGTFGATHVLLAEVGSAGAVRVAGGLLLVAALLLPARRTGAVVGAALLFGALAWGLGGSLPATPSHGTVLASIETPYQWARVEQADDGMRLLRLNEGLDSFHSAYRPGEILTGMYFDAFLVPALSAPVGEDGRRALLVLGLAGGTMARQMLAVDPQARVRGVEIDARVVDLGREWFALPSGAQVDAGVDARVALERIDARWGAILVDAYASQIYVPPHLASLEFFEAVRAHLLPGGVAALNVGGISLEDPVVAALSHTLAAAFGEARVTRLPGTRNMLVLAWNGEPPSREAERQALAEHGLLEALGSVVDAHVTRVLPGTGEPLRDGHAPVEALAHASWSGEWVPFVSEGPSTVPTDPSEWIDRARELVSETRWSEAEALLRRPPADAGAVVRARADLLLGNVAYERGDLDAAGVHWTAAGGLDPSVLPSPERELAAQVRDTARSNAADLLVQAQSERLRLHGDERKLQGAVGATCLALLGAAGWIARRQMR
ncbi:MAG: fused MFS/spermidine synthase [Planctomycetes bacterium]|nr:fused MFS/spermidine synthase [Planctomycetota bacterium]